MTDRWTSTDIPDLSGRTALVTGANAGLGLEISRVLARRGARVLMACRNQQKAEAAAAELRADHPTGLVEVRSLDLARIATIDELAAQLLEEETTLDLLVNNAGLMAVDESRTEDGFETQFGVNHLGHFVLTSALMPLLLSTDRSRVVSMSSMGHRAGRMNFEDPMFERHTYRRWPAYFQSKLANLLFSSELNRRLTAAGRSTISVAAHPGGTRTDLGTEGSGLTNRLMSTVVPVTTQPVSAGALPALRAATDPAVIGGEFYGPRFLVRGSSAVRETPSRRARNTLDAERLWQLSEKLTGRTIEIPTVSRTTAPPPSRAPGVSRSPEGGD